MGVAGRSPRRLVIYGGGGHGLVVAETAVAAGFEVMGFLDDDGNDHRVGPWRILVSESLDEPDVGAVVGIGDNRIRQRVGRGLGEAGRTVVSTPRIRSRMGPSLTRARLLSITAA